MTRRLLTTRGRRLSALAAVLAVLGVAAGALAYFTSTGAGSASASVGAINPPTNVTAQQAGADVTISWNAATLSSGGAVQGYRVTRSDNTTVCGSPTLVTTLSCTDATAAGGSYTYTVTAIFNSFTAPATSGSITILTAPTISTEPSSPSATNAPSFSFSGGGGSGHECQLDGVPFSSCFIPTAYSGLSDGSHTFKVRATSGSSNGPSATYTWTIDTSAPTITIKPANPSNNGSPSFSFTHTEAAYTFECQLDSGGYSACASPQAYSSLADGSHTFQVKAVSADGATTSVASYTWIIDTTPPMTTIALSPSSPNGSAGWYTSAPSFTLSASDTGGSGVASTSYQIDAGATLTYTTAVAVPEGQHTITYWSTDNAGNTETHHTTATIKVDMTAPAASASLAGTLVWANDSSNSIGTATTDGSAVNQNLIIGLASPVGVAVNGSNIFWSNQGSTAIGRANLDGSNKTPGFITGTHDPYQIAVNGSSIYWASFQNANTIAGAALNGSGFNQNFITGANVPIGAAVDGSFVYWGNTGAGTIERAKLDGTNRQILVTGGSNMANIAVDGSHIYWANRGSSTIGRADLNGNNANQAWLTVTPGGGNTPFGIAVDASHIYWSNLDNGRIGRANLDGTTGVNQSFITGAGGPAGLAVLPSPPGALLSGGTLYYNAAVPGSFTVSDAVTDSGSGPASATFPAISTTGWTHPAETVTTASGSAPTSYSSSTFSWTANPSNPTGYTISSRDSANNATATPLTFVNDATAPTGGALSVNGTAASGAGPSSVAYTSSFTVGSRSDYAETQSATQSGLRSSALTVQSETLTGSTCGTPGSGGPFTVPTTITGTAQPSGITTGACYLYTLTGIDSVGNTATISTTVQAVAPPPLRGDWTFASGSAHESTGAWSTFTLHGAASFSNGALVVTGTGNGGNAATAWANASGYSGPTIGDKTLVSSVKLDSLTVTSGSPLGLYRAAGGDIFDSIVFAERQSNQWMAGSNNFQRTQDFSPGSSDTGGPSVTRQVAISYRNNGNGTETITGCFNGTQLGQYTVSSIVTFASTDQPLALFGPRHEASGVPVGSINAHIIESRIYGGAMPCAQVAALP